MNNYNSYHEWKKDIEKRKTTTSLIELLFIAVLLLAVVFLFNGCMFMPDPDAGKPESVDRFQMIQEEIRARQEAEQAAHEGEVVKEAAPMVMAAEIASPYADIEDFNNKVALNAIQEPVQLGEEYFDYENVFGKAGITKYSGEETSIILPDTLGGLPVGVICEYAFSGKPMTCVIMPDTVTDIQNDAFNGCRDLTAVRMHGIEFIGDRAFCGCDKLATVYLPASLKYIGAMAFSSCAAMKRADLGPNMRYIGKGAFLFAGIQCINFPGGIENIPEEVCYHCDNLMKLTIDEGVKTIGRNAFAGCGRLKSVVVPASVEDVFVSSFDGIDDVKFEEKPLIDIGSGWSWFQKGKE